MSRNFYQDADAKAQAPLVPDVATPTDLSTTTLSTGNQIYDSEALHNWFGHWRGFAVNKYHVYKAEWETQKSAAANEWQSAKDYSAKNIATDRYETEELMVPAGILALGAFFTGRVLTNRRNWQRVGGARILTSFPSRLVVPWALAATVVSQLLPATWSNAVRALERDVLPEPWVHQYHAAWEHLHSRGFRTRWDDVERTVDASLQRGIRGVREYVVEQMGW
ncbi:LADA_0C09032g1_1 [Lachancea dasiensis]|uniref:MICOS complex subunit n=1 Tax=Lachancea dasiensis TaxID=1072105 RepID=A0A1G4J0F9_9SACH|nr:LADA_0C09032g1_1 [Lachancea dasiensis]